MKIPVLSISLFGLVASCMAAPGADRELLAVHEVLDKFARESPENARLAQEYIFGAKNGLKAIAAYESGLQNKDILAKKAAQENKLRAAYKAKNPDLPDPWQKIADAMKVQSDIYNRLTYLERK